jgi:hypothetical protein
MDIALVYVISVLVPVCILLIIVVPPIFYIIEDQNKRDQNTYDYYD